jgi:TrmH family RNA methyltransferase
MKHLGNEEFKIYKSLKHKKYRLKYNKFIVEGSKMLADIPEDQYHRVESILYTDTHVDHPILSRLVDCGIPCSSKKINQISTMKSSPGILAVIKDCKISSCQHLDPDIYLYLDRINIPGNVGAIIRTADWFGFKRILLGVNSADIFNPKTLQSSMGSFWNVHMEIASEELLLNSGLPIISTDMDGLNYREINWPESFILLLGNESHGLPKHLKSVADISISIPSFGRPIVDSLNVAATAAVLMSVYRMNEI